MKRLDIHNGIFTGHSVDLTLYSYCPDSIPNTGSGFFVYIGVQIGTSVADYIEQEKTGAAKLTS
jgi:hypothetical protein